MTPSCRSRTASIGRIDWPTLSGPGRACLIALPGGSAGPRLSLVRKCANSNGVTRKKAFVDVR